MLRRALLALCLASGIACETPWVESHFEEPTTTRPYRVITRAEHDRSRAAPVLVVLHPYGVEPDVLLDAYDLARHAAGRRDWVVVVPRGKRDAEGNLAWNATAACCALGERPPDDVAYLDQVLADVERTYALDRERVYALGVSNGAFMAHRWACEPKGPLRAFAAISGVGDLAKASRCEPGHAVDVLQIHGTNDATIRFTGGRREGRAYPSVWETVNAWRARSKSSVEPRRERSWGLVHRPVQRLFWTGESRVALWIVEGGDHHLSQMRHETSHILDFLAGR